MLYLVISFCLRAGRCFNVVGLAELVIIESLVYTGGLAWKDFDFDFLVCVGRLGALVFV